MATTTYRRIEHGASLERVIERVNDAFDVLLGNDPGRIHLLDDDGNLYDIHGGGAPIGTSEPAFKVRSAAGEHVLVQHSNGVDTLFEVQDSGVFAPTLRTDELTIGEWLVAEDGDDLVFTEDGGAERVRFGDSASPYALLVTGDQRITSSLVLNDWKATVSGDDLVWTDDGNVERIRFGDASSAFAALISGDGRVSGSWTVGDWKLLVSGDDLYFQDDAGSNIVMIGDTSSTWHLDVTGPMRASGDIRTGGNLELGTTVSTTGLIRGVSTASWFNRNNANSGNIRLIGKDASDQVLVGDSNAALIFIDAAGGGELRDSGFAVLDWVTGTVTITGDLDVSGTITGTLGGSPTFVTVTATNYLGAAGSKTTPAYAFTGDPDTGIYGVGANQLGFSAGDTLIVTVSTTGVAITGTFSATGLATLTTYSARVTNAAAQTITTATSTTLTFDTERWDTGALHSTSSNTDRLVGPVAGKYMVTASIEWAANVTGDRLLWIEDSAGNIVAIVSQPPSTGGAVTRQSVTTTVDLTAADYVIVRVFQNSGGNLDIRKASRNSPEAMITKVA